MLRALGEIRKIRKCIVPLREIKRNGKEHTNQQVMFHESMNDKAEEWRPGLCIKI